MQSLRKQWEKGGLVLPNAVNVREQGEGERITVTRKRQESIHHCHATSVIRGHKDKGATKLGLLRLLCPDNTDTNCIANFRGIVEILSKQTKQWQLHSHFLRLLYDATGLYWCYSWPPTKSHHQKTCLDICSGASNSIYSIRVDTLKCFF